MILYLPKVNFKHEDLSNFYTDILRLTQLKLTISVIRKFKK